jgi:hypothetical protein
MQKILHFMEGESLNNSFFTKNEAIKRLLGKSRSLNFERFPNQAGTATAENNQNLRPQSEQ